MKKSLVLLLSLLSITLLGYGCDDIGGRVCSENGGRVGGTSSTRLYYPCDISQPTGATTMTGGFMETLQMVSWLSNDLAQEGFVVLAFTPTNVMGMVSGWEAAHVNSINRLKEINQSHSKLRGMIDLDKLQTCGHSKGGGGSLGAAGRLRSELATAVGMAPWREGALNLGSITAATLIQAGTMDTLAISTMTRGEYNSLGNISKAYFTYPVSHMGWVSPNASIRKDIIAWMHYYLDGDTSYYNELKGRGTWVDKN